jgi:hypothetical protein
MQPKQPRLIKQKKRMKHKTNSKKKIITDKHETLTTQQLRRWSSPVDAIHGRML